MTLSLKPLRDCFPHHLKASINQELVDKLNQLAEDPEEVELFRNGLVSYATVLKDGKFKMEDYVNAVIYVSHKLMGCSNQTAWKKTFPQRHMTLIAGGADERKISAYVAGYHANKLVTLILEQSLVPTWILNADIYQKAINVQLEIMTDPDVSPKVRTEAANSILTHLKRPETKKLEIDLGVRENSGMAELRDMMTQLAEQQRSLIEGGVETQAITHQRLRVLAPGEATDAVVVPELPEEAVSASAPADGLMREIEALSGIAVPKA